MQRPFQPDATILCCLNANAALYNAQKLAAVKGTKKTYKAIDTGPKSLLNRITSADNVLTLKVGAKVIVTANVNDNIVNGTRGTIQAIGDEKVKVLLEDGETHQLGRFKFISSTTTMYATRLQLPIKLAYAITVHRAQGQTLESINIDCDGLFAHGMLSVALSRCPEPEKVSIQNLRLKDICGVKPVVVQWYAGEYTTDTTDTESEVSKSHSGHIINNNSIDPPN